MVSPLNFRILHILKRLVILINSNLNWELGYLFRQFYLKQDKKVMFSMLAAILHLSQIEFQETDKTSGELMIVDTEPMEQGKS